MFVLGRGEVESPVLWALGQKETVSCGMHLIRFRVLGSGLCCLVFENFVQFNLIYQGGIRGYSAGSLYQFGGEVEAVFAASVHELQAVEDAFEHGFPKYVDNGVVVIGVFKHFAGSEFGGNEVDADAFAHGGFVAFTFLQHLVVVAKRSLFQIGLFRFEFLEQCWLVRFSFFLLLFLYMAALLRGQHGEVLVGEVYFFLRKGLFFACHLAFECIDKQVLVELEETALCSFCKADAHGPAEGVGLSGKDGVRGFVAAGGQKHGSSEDGNE